MNLPDSVELWPIERLRAYERNPRAHSDDQVARPAVRDLFRSCPSRPSF